MNYVKPKLKVERIANILKSSSGGSLGDSQAFTGSPLINATNS